MSATILEYHCKQCGKTYSHVSSPTGPWQHLTVDCSGIFEPVFIQLIVQRSDVRACVPTYSSSASAGLDLHACIHAGTLMVGCEQEVLVPCHIRLKIPQGFEGRICSRTGRKFIGLVVSNASDVIDCDYHDEIKVILYNTTNRIQVIGHGDRIARLVIRPIYRPQIIETEMLNLTDYGE